MKIALLINRDNFDKYSDWSDTGWELFHMGNAAPDPEKVIATNADVLVVDAMMKIGPDIIQKMPGLKMIHSHGVAFNAIDIECAKNAGIYVCNNMGVNARPVAEQTVLLMLALLKNFRCNEEMVYAGRQNEAKTACFTNGIPELFGRSVGIVGFGAIGRMVATLLKPFGCEVCYYDIFGDVNESGTVYMPLEELYARCDIITLHAAVTPATMNMINEKTLKLLRPGALLINMARGELVEHNAVVNALKSGQLGGFGTDTLAPEPVLPDNPLLCDLPENLRCNVALSPHIGGLSAGAFIRALVHIRENIEAVALGQRPDCVVNGL